MSKSREEKLAERKSHVPVAPTPETAQVLSARGNHIAAPAVVATRTFEDPAATGDTETAQIISEVEPPAPEPKITIVGFDPSFSDTDKEVLVTVVRTEKDGIQIIRVQHSEDNPAPDRVNLEDAFLTFIRSPKGLDLADARVRDVFDQEHRLKEAFRAGWEAARA